MAPYRTYRELKGNETEGQDYRIRKKWGPSGIAVMAPHGGGIEPGTTEIAEAVAGQAHTFYSFSGLKAQGNARLHITSRSFDEPVGGGIAEHSDAVLTIHGCKGADRTVNIGGQDRRLKEKIKNALRHADFPVRKSTRFLGIHPQNICNRSRRGMGVQLEISAGLRREMFPDLSRIERKNRTETFERFVRALREALSDP